MPGGDLEFKDNEIGALEAELINVSLQLNLYLEAGLVISRAFDRLIEDNAENDNPLYRLLRYVNTKSRSSNIGFENELYICAQSVRSKLLMRFAGIVLDSKKRGSSLSEKLENERALMQNQRLSNARARAREAETKLCFPLCILLIVLIAICMAPAMMNM